MQCDICETASNVNDAPAARSEWDSTYHPAVNSHQTVTDLSHASLLLDALQSLHCDSTLCDVTLVVGQRRWPAHRAVLAAASPFFRTLFTSSYDDSTGDVVELRTFDQDVFDAVLRFIYTGVIVLSRVTAASLLDAAEALQISSLRQHVLHYLQDQINEVTALSMWQLARLHDAHEFKSRAWREMQESFSLLAAIDDGFQCLPEEDVELLLTAPFLIAREDAILYGLCRWMERDADGRGEAFRRLVRHVCPSQLNQFKLLSSSMGLHPCLQHPEVHEYLTTVNEEDVARHRYLTQYNRDDQWRGPWPMPGRRCTAAREVIMAIGGATCAGYSSGIECYVTGQDTWKYSVPRIISSVNRHVVQTEPMARMPQMLSFHAAAADDDHIYVMGGQCEGQSTRICARYSRATNELEPNTDAPGCPDSMPPLPGELHGAAACVVDGKLYLLGGCLDGVITSRVWVLLYERGEWQERAPMLVSRSHHCAAVVRGHIYAIGGINNQGTYLSTVCRYDPSADRWTVAPPCGPPRAYASCATVHDRLYLMGGHNGHQWLRSVRRLNPLENQWNGLGAMPQPLGMFAAVVAEDCIFCLGGFTGSDFLRTVSKYNPRTDRWHSVASLHLARWGLAAAKLTMPVLESGDP